MNYTSVEVADIIKHPAVESAMRRIVGNRLEPVPQWAPMWRIAGRDIPTGPFRLLYAIVKRAVKEALTSAEGRDRERLMILLRVAEDDPPADVAEAAAIAVEDYAVAMQHGAAGIHSYRAFIGGSPNDKAS